MLCYVMSHPSGSLGATYDVHLRLVGKRVVDFLLVLIELFHKGLRLRLSENRLKIVVLQRGAGQYLPNFRVEGDVPHQSFIYG